MEAFQNRLTLNFKTFFSFQGICWSACKLGNRLVMPLYGKLNIGVFKISKSLVHNIL